MVETLTDKRKPHIVYPKVVRLGKVETDGILDGVCYIQHKLDGANASVWVDDGKLVCGSRNHIVPSGFRGLVDYINQHEGVKELLTDYPHYRLFGEWLVPHTIPYSTEMLNEFYLFDVLDEVTGDWVNPVDVDNLASIYKINHIQLYEIRNPTIKKLNEFLKSERLKMGGKLEGFVIKNPKFINKFGHYINAKLVADEFIEASNGKLKHSNIGYEDMFADKYVTEARVVKAINSRENAISHDDSFIKEMIGKVYHDIVQEEIWEMQKKAPTINFRLLFKECAKRVAKILLNKQDD